MSLPDYSIDPKILKSATEEFLLKGYKNASLREICQKAGVTTGALYNRFSGKGALFDAIVEPTINDLTGLAESVEKYDYDRLEQNEMKMVWDASEETLKNIIEFLYARYEGFKLLLCCSEGSAYANFLHDFVIEHTKSTMQFANQARLKNFTDNRIDEEELHILLTSYWTAIFETVTHDFPKEKALHHCSIMTKLFNWQAILGF